MGDEKALDFLIQVRDFCKRVKRELVNGASFAAIEQALLEMMKGAETDYYPKRLHSESGYYPSVAFGKIIFVYLDFVVIFS